MRSSKRFASWTEDRADDRVASPIGSAAQNGVCGPMGKFVMDDIRLPKHVIAKAEQRWANKLQQEAEAWSSRRPHGSQAGQLPRDKSRSTPLTVIKRPRRNAA